MVTFLAYCWLPWWFTCHWLLSAKSNQSSTKVKRLCLPSIIIWNQNKWLVFLPGISVLLCWWVHILTEDLSLFRNLVSWSANPRLEINTKFYMNKQMLVDIAQKIWTPLSLWFLIPQCQCWYLFIWKSEEGLALIKLSVHSVSCITLPYTGFQSNFTELQKTMGSMSFTIYRLWPQG